MALLEPTPGARRKQLFTQRWTGARWTAPVDVGGVSYDSSFALAGSGTLLTGVWAVDPPGFGQRVRLRVQGARGGDLVSPSGVLHGARVSVTRSRILHRSRWSTLVDLGRARAKRTATVRFVPRHGRAVTMRLVVRGRVA